MSIYIGENRLISKKDIIAILDSDCTLECKTSQDFIKGFKDDSVIKINSGRVKTYILTQNEDKIRLYESSISSTSIEKKFEKKGLKFIDE